MYMCCVTSRKVDAATSGDCMQCTGWREINGESCIGYDNAQVRDIFGRPVSHEGAEQTTVKADPSSRWRASPITRMYSIQLVKYTFSIIILHVGTG